MHCIYLYVYICSIQLTIKNMKNQNPYKLKDMAGNVKVFRANSLSDAKELAKKEFRTNLVFVKDLNY